MNFIEQLEDKYREYQEQGGRFSSFNFGNGVLVFDYQDLKLVEIKYLSQERSLLLKLSTLNDLVNQGWSEESEFFYDLIETTQWIARCFPSMLEAIKIDGRRTWQAEQVMGILEKLNKEGKPEKRQRVR